MNILITGASRGLGCAIAAEALTRGHAVIAGVRAPDEERLGKLAAEYGGRLRTEQLDVTDEAGIAALAARLKREGVTLGAIVNNAAILAARDTPIEALAIEDLARSLDVNLYGPVRIVKHLLPLLTEPGAAVVNISSEAGSITNAYPNDYPYGISKAALNMFTRQLHGYLKERGILSLSVHPGWMRTDMGGPDAPTDPKRSASGILDLIERKTPADAKLQFVDYTGREMQI